MLNNNSTDTTAPCGYDTVYFSKPKNIAVIPQTIDTTTTAIWQDTSTTIDNTASTYEPEENELQKRVTPMLCPNKAFTSLI